MKKRQKITGLFLIFQIAIIMIFGTNAAAKFPFYKFLKEFRSIDGYGNNLDHPTWGGAGEMLLRSIPADYEDGYNLPAGYYRRSARKISNAVAAQKVSKPNLIRLSDFVWQWGQFLDHDIDLTEIAVPFEPFDILVPKGDPYFDPDRVGGQIIELERSFYIHDDYLVRQQINSITSFIDASNVYGSDEFRATALRRNDGTGKLLTSPGRLLPFNWPGLPNAGGPDPTLFLAGDVRANEQVGLTAMHTLFVREHNRWASLIKLAFPFLKGDKCYQLARAIVGAEMQAITYNEWLPAILGRYAPGEYKGYDPTCKPDITNEFATAIFRWGHSMLSPELKMIPGGKLPLNEAFFAPEQISDRGIEPFLRGMAHQVCQNLDNRIVEAVRNFLFGKPGEGGLDLASLNIQRGRDHGLPSYNEALKYLGLSPAKKWKDISSHRKVRKKLKRVYDSVDDVDLWVGGLAEDPVGGSIFGELVSTVMKDQFERLRDCDRFFYKNHMPPFLCQLIDERKLSTIIWQNTHIRKFQIPENVFIVP